MAQTTGAISFKAAKVEIGTTGTTAWSDISGTFNKVEVGGRERAVGSIHTADGDTPIVTRGKLSAADVTVTCVYTEVAGEAFKVVHDLFVASGGTDFWIRWTPAGSATTYYRYTSGAGVINSVTLPVGEVGAGTPVMFAFKVTAPSITQATNS